MREPRNKVVQVRRFGGPDELAVVEAPLPTAGRGEVRVRVLASGLEYTDVLIRRHLYPQTMRRRPPFAMGYDVVGEIDQLGDGVSGFQLGDRVADMTVLGSNAVYRTLRASLQKSPCRPCNARNQVYCSCLSRHSAVSGPRRSPSTSRQAATAEA